MRLLIKALCILLLLTSSAFASSTVIVVGQPTAAGAGSCTTQAVNQSYTTGATSYAELSNTSSIGQSFTPSSSAKLYSLSFFGDYDTTNASLTIRVGSSADVTSSYLVEYSCNTMSYSEAEFECVIAEGSRPNLSASTTYYIRITAVGDAYPAIKLYYDIDSGDAYSGQTYTTEVGGTVWNPSGYSAGDMYFKATMCTN